MENPQTVRSLIQTLWDYNKLGQDARSADLLIVMGTNDTRVADYAATIEQTHIYKHIVVTGGVFHEKSLTRATFDGTEANVFHEILIGHGLASDKILIEGRATNTGENITLTHELVNKYDLEIASAHMVHTPTMERRSYATAMRQWPTIEWSVSSQAISYDDYIVGVDETRLIHGIVGDTFRMLIYPGKGFQIAQEMPRQVLSALTQLLGLGFTNSVPSDYMLVIKDI